MTFVGLPPARPGWTPRPLKAFLQLNDSGMWGEDPTGEADTVVLRSTDIAINGDWTLEDPALRSLPASDVARKRLKAGDLVVVKSSGSELHLGKVALADADIETLGAAFSNFMQRLRPNSSADPRYLRYLLNSRFGRDQMVNLGRTSTGLQNLNGSVLGSVLCPGPPFEHQRAIADYLDAEIGAMDGVLSRKLRMIRLLQEQIDSTILRFIGVSPLVRSDPELAARPLRRMLAKLDRPTEPDGQVVTAFRDGQVTARALRRADGFTESWTDGARVQGVCRDDVVVHGLDGFAGAIGTSEADGVCSPIYHVCAPLDGGDPHFYGQMLRLLATTGYLGNFATSTRERAVDFRNWDLFGRIPLPVVDVVEQRKIGDRIRRLAPIRERVARSGVLLLERRQALITAGVTGQLEIPGAAA